MHTRIHWNAKQFKSKYLIISFKKQITFNYCIHILWPLMLSISISRCWNGEWKWVSFHEMMNNSNEEERKRRLQCVRSQVVCVCVCLLVMCISFYWTQLFNCCVIIYELQSIQKFTQNLYNIDLWYTHIAHINFIRKFSIATAYTLYSILCGSQIGEVCTAKS